MTGFDAYFYECKFFINGKKEYALGEILAKYLSKNLKILMIRFTNAKSLRGNYTIPKI